MESPTRIALFGDTHGNERYLSDAIRFAADLGVTRGFALGDWGMWFSQSSLDEARNDPRVLRLEETCREHGFTLEVILGNHEAFDIYEAAQAESGTDFAVVSEHVRILPRVFIQEIAGVRIASLAGAASVDFESRRPAIPGISGSGTWWYQEAIEDRHVAELTRLAGNRPVDVLLMHDAPSSPTLLASLRATSHYWSDRALEYADIVRHRVDDAVTAVHPRLVCSGHYHQHVDCTYAIEDGHELRSVVLDYEGNLWSVAVLDLDETLTLHEVNLHVRTAWEKLIARGIDVDPALDDEQLETAWERVRETESSALRARVVAVRAEDAGEIVVEVED